MIGAIEHAVLILGHLRKLLQEAGVDIDVARRAGATPAAYGENFVDAGTANHLHDRKTRLSRDGPLNTLARDNSESRHVSSHSVNRSCIFCYASAAHPIVG